MELGPGKSVPIAVSTQYKGKRYIVVRDEANRDTHIGWVDLEAIAKSSKPVMLIDGLYVAEQSDQVYTIDVPYTEVRKGADGRDYTVTLARRESRIRTVEVKKRDGFALRVCSGGDCDTIASVRTNSSSSAVAAPATTSPGVGTPAPAPD